MNPQLDAAHILVPDPMLWVLYGGSAGGVFSPAQVAAVEALAHAREQREGGSRPVTPA